MSDLVPKSAALLVLLTLIAACAWWSAARAVMAQTPEPTYTPPTRMMVSWEEHVLDNDGRDHKLIAFKSRFSGSCYLWIDERWAEVQVKECER